MATATQNTPSSFSKEKLAKTIVAITLVVIGITLAFHWIPKWMQTPQTTVETITVSLGKWTEIKTDPDKEIMDFNPMDGNVNWQVVVNGDFLHPIPILVGRSNQNLGLGIKKIDVSLMPNYGLKKASFILKRIPK